MRSADSRRLLGQIDQGTHVEPSKSTVVEFLTRWLDEFIGRQVSPKTLERYREFCEIQIIPRIGDVKLQRLTGARIDALYTELLSSGSKRGKPLAPRTVHHVHGVLKQALEQAVRWHPSSRNPAGDATAPKVEDGEIEILTQEQIASVMEARRSAGHIRSMMRSRSIRRSSSRRRPARAAARSLR